MSLAQRHVIRRESIDLTVEGGESEGLALQERLAVLCRDELARALDEALARVAPGDEHWRFERIEVDAGHFTPEAFERDFVATVAAAVEQQVRTRKVSASPPTSVEPGSEDDVVRMSDAQSIHVAFLHFLASGVLPWWCRLPVGRSLEAMVMVAWGRDVPVERLRAAMLRTLGAPSARRRLARQFSVAFLGSLLERVSPGTLAMLYDIAATDFRRVPGHGADDVPEHGWVAAFGCLATHHAITRARLREAWITLAPEGFDEADEAACAPSAEPAPDPHDTDSTTSERDTMTSRSISMEPDVDPASGAPRSGNTPVASNLAASAGADVDLREGIFIDCAGVVLLHPFLPILFQRLDISADGQLVQPDRALALLHFLATGETGAPEHALALPKLLCGLEPSALIGAPVELSERERDEAHELLKSAIGHWGALGDASPDALRGNFLVRPGKLSRRADDDFLQVERQAFDVLLGRLPWGIAAVGLPWMKRLLWVEWLY